MKFLLLVFEIIFISLLFYRFHLFLKNYRAVEEKKPFIEKWKISLSQSFPQPVSSLITRETTMFYYLFSKKTEIKGDSSFSYHQTVGYKSILIVLMAVIMFEGIGFFFLLHQWQPILSWIHFGLNIYGLLYLISDYRAILQLPISITDEVLHIPVGSRKEISIPIENIASVTGGTRFHEEKKQKDIFKAIILELDTPQFEINFKEPIIIKSFLGKEQPVVKVYVTVDDKNRFYQLLTQKMKIHN